MTGLFNNKYVRAITTKVIAGSCISAIPIGTEFWVISEIWEPYQRKYKPIDDSCFYRPCMGLGVSLIWNDEYKILEENED